MKYLFFVFSFLASAFSFATSVDVSSLTAAVDFSSVTTALLAVAATLVGVYICWRAAKFVLSAVRGL